LKHSRAIRQFNYPKPNTSTQLLTGIRGWVYIYTNYHNCRDRLYTTHCVYIPYLPASNCIGFTKLVVMVYTTIRYFNIWI